VKKAGCKLIMREVEGSETESEMRRRNMDSDFGDSSILTSLFG